MQIVDHWWQRASTTESASLSFVLMTRLARPMGTKTISRMRGEGDTFIPDAVHREGAAGIFYLPEERTAHLSKGMHRSYHSKQTMATVAEEIRTFSPLTPPERNFEGFFCRDPTMADLSHLARQAANKPEFVASKRGSPTNRRRTLMMQLWRNNEAVRSTILRTCDCVRSLASTTSMRM